MSIVTEMPARFAAVTPNDAADLPELPDRGGATITVYNGDGETIRVIGPYGDDVTFTVAGAEFHIPGQVRRVMATGTNATTIIASW